MGRFTILCKVWGTGYHELKVMCHHFLVATNISKHSPCKLNKRPVGGSPQESIRPIIVQNPHHFLPKSRLRAKNCIKTMNMYKNC